MGARVETTWVPGAFQLWVKGESTCTAPPRRWVQRRATTEEEEGDGPWSRVPLLPLGLLLNVLDPAATQVALTWHAIATAA
jgi:hypothetical protein